LLAVLALATASLGALYGAREEAATGADAAALAAAVASFPPAWRGGSPEAAASAAAAANGVALVACDCAIDTSLTSRVVTVITASEVRVPLFGEMTVRVRSRAEFDPALWLGL
jgi:hypothetical protein